jgi:hypothetical protein
MTRDGSIIAVSFCIKGDCHFSGLWGFDANSVGVAYRSLDGGITWQEVARGGPVFWVGGVLADGRVLITHGSKDDGVADYYLVPGNTSVSSPIAESYPVASGDQIFWASYPDSRLLYPDGTLYFQPPDGGQAYYNTVAGYLGTGKASTLLYWQIPGPLPRPNGYIDRWGIGLVEEQDGDPQLVQQWEIDGYLWTIGSWSSKNYRAFVSFYPEDPSSTYESPRPALIDFDAGVYYMIPRPFESGDRPGYSSLGRTAVHAVQTGPFSRIINTGSCLRVRAEPSLSGQVLDCLADGVLLQDMGETREADGATWLSVVTPGRRQGWASIAFLER